MFALQKDNVLVYVNGLGSHVRILFTNLDDEELCETLVQSVAELIVNLADGVQSIHPERCENNLPADTLPLCLPRAYSVMSPCECVDLVMRFRSCLEIHFNENEIDTLEVEQKNLCEVYLNEPTLKAALNGMGESVSVENAW